MKRAFLPMRLTRMLMLHAAVVSASAASANNFNFLPRPCMADAVVIQPTLML
jgi:hypothetical protein